MSDKPKVQEKVQAGGQAGVAVAAPAADPLSKFGGLSFVESFIDGFSNLNPERKARKNIFLASEEWQDERDTLAERLNIWKSLLEGNDSIEKMVEVSKKEAATAEETLNKT